MARDSYACLTELVNHFGRLEACAIQITVVDVKNLYMYAGYYMMFILSLCTINGYFNIPALEKSGSELISLHLKKVMGLWYD